MRVFVLAAALTAWTTAVGAGEVYKCVEDGKTVFQDVPCSGSGAKVSVKPANAPTSPATDSPAPKDSAPPSQTALSKLKQNVEAMENERRQRENEYEIRGLENDIYSYESRMEIELTALQRKKAYAANNLAGATWEQSISTEMEAVSEKYRTRIQIAQDRITQLEREVEDLKLKHP